MPTHTKSRDGHSAVSLLTELAVEGTSSLVEAQRTLLTLAQQENEILLKGAKEQVGGFLPAVALTDLVRRSLDTFIDLQQELLTNTSKQTIHWLQANKTKGVSAEQLADFAREGVETFTKAQKKFLDVVAQEATKTIEGKHAHDGKPVKKTELVELAREAGNAFVEAQKKLLDIIGQQINVNLDVATRTLEKISPSRLLPISNLTGEGVKSFVEAQKSIIASLIPSTKKEAAETKRGRTARRHEAVPA